MMFRSWNQLLTQNKKYPATRRVAGYFYASISSLSSSLEGGLGSQRFTNRIAMIQRILDTIGMIASSSLVNSPSKELLISVSRVDCIQTSPSSNTSSDNSQT